uniref:Neuronal migration protein doublecortin n=1 Tax=Panagrellus redivivus TaxID=6233 RepID=A0A7E4W2X0_PANRE
MSGLAKPCVWTMFHSSSCLPVMASNLINRDIAAGGRTPEEGWHPLQDRNGRIRQPVHGQPPLPGQENQPPLPPPAAGCKHVPPESVSQNAGFLKTHDPDTAESAPIDEEYISDCYSEEEYASDGDSEEEYLEKIYAEMNKQDDQTDLPQIEPLLKPQYNTTEEALSQFNRVFEKRYGSDLAFRQTSMKAAAAEAADGPEIATQKPIFMYLHSDSSITANKKSSCPGGLIAPSVANLATLFPG